MIQVELANRQIIGGKSANRPQENPRFRSPLAGFLSQAAVATQTLQPIPNAANEKKIYIYRLQRQISALESQIPCGIKTAWNLNKCSNFSNFFRNFKATLSMTVMNRTDLGISSPVFL
jgi:hypothetical protein